MSADVMQLVAVPAILVVGGALVAILGAARSRTRAIRPVVGILAVLTLVAAIWTMMLWPKLDSAAATVQAKLVLDPLTVYAALVAIVGSFLAVLIAFNQPANDQAGEFFAMILFAAAGLIMVGLAANLLVMFLALELVAIPGFVLVGLSRRHRFAEEAGAKYFFLGAFAAAITAFGFVLLFAAAGTMDFTQTHAFAANDAATKWLAVVGWILAFVGLTFKLTAVPFHVYAPDVYQGAGAGVTGLIAFLPKVAGFVALLRLAGWVGFDGQVWQAFFPLLWIVAAVTVTAGNVLALREADVKRILAYSSIAHTGYMLVGLAAATAPGALGAVLFYVFIYGIMTLGAFGVIAHLAASQTAAAPTEDPAGLTDLAGLSQRRPAIAFALAVFLFSLIGIPPTGGFWAKLYVFAAALTSHDVWLILLVVIALVNAAIAAVYYLRILAAAYMNPTRELPLRPARMAFVDHIASLIGLALAAALILLIGLFPGPVLQLSEQAAEALLAR